MRIEFGNISQITSAITSVIVAGIGIYALFFSSTSQMFVTYLQSELTQRNFRIAILEKHEEELQNSVKTRENELSSLQKTSTNLKNEINNLASQRDQLAGQISKLQIDQSKLQFLVVREKMGVTLASRINIVLPLKLVDEIQSPTGSKARKEEIWTHYVKSVSSAIKELSPEEQKLGLEVARNFTKQCHNLSTVRIDIPNLKYPRWDDPNYAGKEKYVSQKQQEVSNKFFSAENDLAKCFHQLVPDH